MKTHTRTEVRIGPYRYSCRRAVDAAGLYRAIGLPVPSDLILADIGLGPNEIDIKLVSQDETQIEPSLDDKTVSI